MKSIRFLLPALLLFVTLFIGCGKEDDPPATNGAFTSSKTTVAVDEEVQFTNTSANATSYTWSFGDGTTSTEASPKKSYSTSGIYTVTLSATGAGGTKSATAVITVIPISGFTVVNENSLSAGTPVQFTNTSKGAATYEWSFGDAANTKSTEANPTFTYAAGGTYTVSLKSTGVGGSATSTKEVVITAVVSNKELYFIEYGNNLIKKLLLKSGETPSNVVDVTGKAGVGLAYDPIGNKVYFSDFEIVGEGKIWRMNLDGSGLETIVSGLTDPYSIALNIAGNKIYWGDDLGNISRSNMDGTGLDTNFIKMPGGQIRGVAYDNKHDKIYFYEVNGENLHSANGDGTNIVIVAAATYGYGIYVDEVNDKLYYDDRAAMALMMSNLDGSNPVKISDALTTRIFGIDIDRANNKLYWSDRDKGEIKKSNLDGTAPETVLTGLLSPRGIFIK